MDKKTKIIYICLAVFVVVVLLLSWIVDRKETNGDYTCKASDHEISFTVEKDIIKNIYFKINKPYSEYGYETSNLTSYQKQDIEKEILYDFGIDKFNYDGIDIKLTYSNNLIIEINVDYSKASTEILKKLGLNYNKSIKFSTIKQLIKQDKIYECK